MNDLIKDLSQGSRLYVLTKNDSVTISDGSIVSVSRPRLDTQNQQVGAFPLMNTPATNVVDVTFSVNGKTFTETINENSAMFVTSQLGGSSLVTTDNDAILRELNNTLKDSKEYVANVPIHEKRIKQCEKLIAERDTAYAEKQATNARISKIEDTLTEITKMLGKVLNKEK